jgi:predicted nucleotidyltransferase
MMKRPQIIQSVKKILREVAPEAEVILYGSEARGDARKDSDIDLLILVDKEKSPIRT